VPLLVAAARGGPRSYSVRSVPAVSYSAPSVTIESSFLLQYFTEDPSRPNEAT
jgi:hypothetical protein